MKERQIKLIKHLTQTQEWTYGVTLANLFGVSSRTIRMDIEQINQHYPNLVESNRRLGYRVTQAVDLGRITTESPIPNTPEKRWVYWFQQLFLGPVHLIKIESKLFISAATVEQDIRKLKNLIQVYPALSLVRKDNLLELLGPELSKRKLYRDLVYSELQNNEFDVTRISHLFTRFDLDQVIALLDRMIDQAQFSIRRLAQPLLYIHVGILIDRILEGKYMNNEQSLICHQESLDLARAFTSELSHILDCQIPEAEVVNVAQLLNGYRTEREANAMIVWQNQTINLNDLVDDLLSHAQQGTGIYFQADEELQQGLQLHFQALFSRVAHHHVLINPLLQDIKENHPLIMEMAVKMANHFKKRFDIILSEDEISFLALHIGTAYTRMHQEQKLRGLVVSLMGEKITGLAIEKIERTFSDRLEIVGKLNRLDAKQVSDWDVDVVISLAGPQNIKDVPVIQVSSFLMEKDINQLFVALQAIERKRLNTSLLFQMEKYIWPQFFHQGLQVQSVEQVIAVMGEALKTEKVVDDQFVDSVLKRESFSATSFQPGIAIPHALNNDSHTSAISIALLAKPIQWGNHMVSLVLMPVFTEKDHQFMTFFFEWIGRVSEEHHLLQALFKAKDRDAFINLLMSELT